MLFGRNGLAFSKQSDDYLASEIRRDMSAAQFPGTLNLVSTTIFRVIHGLVSPAQGFFCILSNAVFGNTAGDCYP